MTVLELATIADSTETVCITDEGTLAVSLVIEGMQLRVGAGPTLQAVQGVGLTADLARTDFAAKVAGQVVVVGGNPRGLELRVPTTIIGFAP